MERKLFFSDMRKRKADAVVSLPVHATLFLKLPGSRGTLAAKLTLRRSRPAESLGLHISPQHAEAGGDVDDFDGAMHGEFGTPLSSSPLASKTELSFLESSNESDSSVGASGSELEADSSDDEPEHEAEDSGEFECFVRQEMIRMGLSVTVSDRALFGDFDASVRELCKELETRPVFHYDDVYCSKGRPSKRRATMNETETLQLLWAKRHHVTDSCMRDFCALVNHPNFQKESVVSASTIKRRVQCLPVDPAPSVRVNCTQRRI